MNRESAEPETPSSQRVDRRIWWFIASNTAESSCRMMMENREASLAVWGSSVTLAEQLTLKPGW